MIPRTVRRIARAIESLRSQKQRELHRALIEPMESRLLLSVNPIVAENQLPGTPSSQWDVSGSGDPTIQGFATDMSVNVGQTVSFKINDTARAPYHLDIYRVGYYQGNGARLVTSIAAAQTRDVSQPAPVSDATTGLVDCGNWSVTASWQVPSTAVSGIYFAKVIRDDTGGASHVFFIVRNDASHSDILFKTSDATWVAYNDYGGNSLYTGTSNAAPGRAVEASYNRPFADRGGLGNTDQFFYAEFPMVLWLEQNGYDVSYFTDSDVDTRGSEILQHKLFMSTGHDEYWSGNERANVVAARDAGVNLAFFSGNEMFWKTRFISSTSNTDGTDTSDRILVTYKETHANAVIDPLDPTVWTGTWMDPRFSPPGDGGQPQNAVTGTLFTVNSGQNGTGTPMSVPFSDAAMRIWRNTTIASLQPGQTGTLGADAQVLGYEWDEDVDNGFRPAGLIDLSSTTQNVAEKFIDYGNVVVPATATHSLTLYRVPSGALVFGAGTVQWSWGLDGDHDGPGSKADPNMQQATVNLFADMGVQPATLQDGLVAAVASTDHTAPTSTITSPAPGAALVSGTPVTITGTAVDSGGGVVAGVEVSTDGGQTWHPATGRANWSYTWTPGKTGSVTILSRASDDSANLSAASAGVTVTVNPPNTTVSMWSSRTLPSSIDSADPTATEVGVRFQTDISGFISGIRFYKASTNTGTHVAHLWTSSGQLLATATFTSESASGWQQVNFAQPIAVTAGATYIASYFAPNGHYSVDVGYFSTNYNTGGPLHALTDTAAGRNGMFAYLSGGGFPATPSPSSSNYWVDVVFGTANVMPPIVIGQSPAAQSLNDSTTAPVTLTFNKSINPSTLVFSLTDSSGNAVSATVSYNDSTHTATLTPTSPLGRAAKYQVSASGARDSLGNVMSPIAWTFYTGPTFSLWPATAVPQNSSANDGGAVEVGVKLRADASGFINAIRFYKGAGNGGTHVGHVWSSAGALLGTATFTNESASGWQEATLSTPVAVTAGSTYIVSYYAPQGHYAADGGYFASAGVDSGPLHALSNTAAGGNGVYAYGTGNTFPANSYNSANYWVDAVYAPSPPAVIAQTPAAGSSGVGRNTPVSVTFGAPVDPTTVSFVLKDQSGNVVATTFSYSGATNTATLTPNTVLASNTSYTATVSGATDTVGESMDSPFTWSFTTGTALTYRLWSNAAAPQNPSANDGASVELGVKVRTDTSGLITAIRFYKGAGNGGTHVGHVWSSAGALLGTATFTNESASGWQEATLSTPVAVTAGSTYIISYYAPLGHYAADGGYFASAGVDSGPLHALSNSAGGGNGVYAYSSGNSFPANTYNSANYWVDAVFATSPPAVVAKTPAAGGQASATTTVTATFNEPVVPTSISFVLTDSSGNSVPGTVSYNSTTQTATFTPTQALNVSATYTATVSGAQDAAGFVMDGSVVWSFTIANQWTQTTAADFSGGQTSGAAVTNFGGGEVRLAPAVFDDFTGTALGSGWKVTSWAPAGGGPTSVTVSGGVASFAGAEVLSSQGYTASTFEARVSLAAAPYQHFGVATDLANPGGNYWAIFSTTGTSNTLFAWVNVNGSSQTVNIGALPAGFHDYRIQPVSGGFAFYMDGALMTTISATLPTGTTLKAAFSSFTSSALQVDSVAFGPSATSGSFVSSVFDTGKTATVGSVQWTADLPAGTTITVQVSTSTDGINWSTWQTVSNGGVPSVPAGRYIRYQVFFTTANSSLTPVLKDISLNWA